MHRISLALSLLLLPLFHAFGLSVETAYSRYLETGDIRPISQYFGGSLTRQGFRSVVPSQPNHPAGQYFILKLGDPGSPAPAQARISLINSVSKELSTHTWELAGSDLKKWVYLGLTGSDWSSDEIVPLAWRIELVAADGSVTAEWKSFLWEMP